MPIPALLLVIAVALPAVSSGFQVVFGKRLGYPLAGWVATAFIVGSFSCTLGAMFRWYEGQPGHEWGWQAKPLYRAAWLPAEGSESATPLPNLGIYIDSLTMAMFAAISLVSTVIHIYAVTFFRSSEQFWKPFIWMALATCALLASAISVNLIQWLLFGPVLTLSLYRLLGPSVKARTAARPALAIHLVGDIVFASAIIYLLKTLGNISLPFLWTMLGSASAGLPATLPGGAVLSTHAMSTLGICLLIGVLARCALFPLHVWVGAIAGTTAPAAGIFLALNLSTGIYFIARLFPLLTPDIRLALCIIGITTMAMGVLISLAQDDMIRALAWLAVAEVGYMAVALGVGSWIGAMFQLVNNAFAMTLLALAVGNVILSTRGQRLLSKSGWLVRSMPATAILFAIGALALAGVPFLNGRYSQAMITGDSAAYAYYTTSLLSRSKWHWVLYWGPVVCSAVVGFSLVRIWVLTFVPRSDEPKPEPTPRDYTGLWVPLLALAIPTVIAGYAMSVPELLDSSVTETRALCRDLAIRSGRAWPDENAPWHIWPATLQPAPPADSLLPDLPSISSPIADAHKQGRSVAAGWPSWVWVVGVGVAIALFWRGRRVIAILLAFPPLRWIQIWLANEMFFGDLYRWTIVRWVELMFPPLLKVDDDFDSFHH